MHSTVHLILLSTNCWAPLKSLHQGYIDDASKNVRTSSISIVRQNINAHPLTIFQKCLNFSVVYNFEIISPSNSWIQYDCTLIEGKALWSRRWAISLNVGVGTQFCSSLDTSHEVMFDDSALWYLVNWTRSVHSGKHCSESSDNRFFLKPRNIY